ncbi:NUDIX domain-containing protein [Streptomyces sp. NPDC046203]|uniref:NUDIX domain-containing protein n=1 Tax=Streptomyces sp. NPDC046203 TaxID=3154602 RepID=UPI0033F540B6
MTQQGIAVAVVVHEHRVLLVRGQTAGGEPFWQFPVGPFPVGGIETGEAVEDAAVRATLAGAGLAVTSAGLLGARTHPHTGAPMTYVACSPAGEPGEPPVREPDETPAAGVVWAGRDEIRRYVPYDELFAPVREYLDARL